MAEALALLGLVANIFQFIEQGYAVVSGAKEVYKSGQSGQARDIRLLLEDINNSSSEIQSLAPNSLSKDELAIRNYSAECDALAAELSVIADKLTFRDAARSRRLESIRVAYQNATKKGDVQKLTGQLKDLDHRLRTRLRNVLDREAVKTHDGKQSSIIAMIDDLEKTSQNLGAIIVKDFGQLQNAVMSRLMSSESVMSSLVRSLAEEGQKTAAHHDLLGSLLFPEIRQRCSDIDPAHEKTLKWLFDPSRTSFPGWLESSSGIYWVNGQAGSGKSTLMKYAYEQDMTHRILAGWAGQSRLITAHFYFWNQGTAMQKSQHGLLQSLLFQVLKADADLAMHLCPDRHRFEVWTKQELYAAFERMSMTAPAARFCFFIDGLDEYDGAEEDIIQTVQKLASCPQIKICVSSRPWNRFREAFGSFPQLVVQDLTRPDIELYIEAELEESAAFQSSVARDSRCRGISSEVATRAQGVFLWVYLVVRDLKRDLQSQENFEHLRRRVDVMPPTLDKYFQRIFDRIDPIYREQTARLFLLALFVDTQGLYPLPPQVCECLEREGRDPDYATKETVEIGQKDFGFWSADQADSERVAIARLNDRCRDLLQLRPNLAYQNGFLHHKHVSFLHRTVRDFLRDSYLSQLERNAGQFSAVHSYSLMLLSLFKKYAADLFFGQSERRWRRRHGFKLSLVQFWAFAQSNKAAIADTVLEEFAKTSAQFVPDWPTRLMDGPLDRHQNMPSELQAMSWAISTDMALYVRRNWKPDISAAFSECGLPALSLALAPHSISGLDSQKQGQAGTQLRAAALNVDTVRTLLELGCNPNELGCGLDFLCRYYWCRCETKGLAHLTPVGFSAAMARQFYDSEDNAFYTARLLFEHGLRLPVADADVVSRRHFRSFFKPIFGSERVQELWLIHASHRLRNSWMQRMSVAFGFV